MRGEDDGYNKTELRERLSATRGGGERDVYA